MSIEKAEARETRDIVEGLELRAAPEGSKGPGTLVGYAAVFGKYSCDLGSFREVIAPGAFAKALAACDVRALYNHEPECLLGRTSAGTLRLAEDELGLRVEIDLPDTSLGRDVAELVRRRDLRGQSFSFTTAIDQWDTTGETYLRTVVEVKELFDVGPVAFPAYEETSAAMRSYRSARESHAAPPTPGPAPDEDAGGRDSARLRLLSLSR